ncbi:glutathione S-transferase [Synechococcales cyanobacterium C]|uniref:Glutathione S-transferase n=1 Tax=Petrachloros mirabilis ULC683 TaxID=2781853 RepID=A0A8K2A6S6_9CYAN|nr:glutathione S-transferase family protein [Petrachloros mirabilis]NCJ05544.1 glutathione S-transferase [Petrachloros mirabilis ULC683]
MNTPPLTWSALEAFTDFHLDRENGPTNAQARLRLFGQPESAVRVTLYRDHHAWCPYCQKVWLWLEEKEIPYRIAKVTMFCYGQKEHWYKRKVPSGMLPALELDGRLITESDEILVALEQAFGSLGTAMTDPEVIPLRQLERRLFRAWCLWLCYPARSEGEEQRSRHQFIEEVTRVEAALARTPGSYFLVDFSTADVIFTPYVERMHASLYYYKGYSLRTDNPGFSAWFDALEQRPTYRGTQSDFHTHAHDLPPQMGGCYANSDPQTRHHQHQVDHGPWFGLPDVAYSEPETARAEALHRVLKHRVNLIRVNPTEDSLFDAALRCALTFLITGEPCVPPPGSEVGLRYMRDRISVPRDMSIYAAKHLRQALEKTAALVGDTQPPALPVKHRRDQDPANFVQL